MRNDQIFTPSYIVTKMLDQIGYAGENIRTKTIFEPSFGEGAFLCQILNRALEYIETHCLTETEAIMILNNIHGVEIDKELYQKTKRYLTEQCRYSGINYSFPNLINGDTTKMEFNHEYDIICGNPPYIKIHDTDESEREYIKEKFQFSQGNTDIYITFFELGLNALKEDGILSYIAPNSYMKNSSQKEFRKYLSDNHLVSSIIDYGNVAVFGDIATYTAITTLHKEKKQTTKYVKMQSHNKVEYKTEVDLSTFGANPWSIVSKDDDSFLKKIRERKTKLSDLCDIQYGLATNADKVYLVSSKDIDKFEKELLRPVVKASKLDNSKYIIFPYLYDEEKERFEVIDEETMKVQYPKTYTYLLLHKERLISRDMDKGAIWYQYARSQGIQNSNNEKLVISRFIDGNAKTCPMMECDENTLVYSGMYIIPKDEGNREKIKEMLSSEEFCRYLQLVGKDMSGGYKAFNTKMVKEYGV